MTNVEALKDLAAVIVGGSTPPEAVPGKTTAEVIETIAQIKRGGYAQGLTVTSEAGTSEGDTKITVSPAKAAGNSYVYTVSATAVSMSENLAVIEGTAWNGTDEITLDSGKIIGIYELNSDSKAVKFGQAVAEVNPGE